METKPPIQDKISAIDPSDLMDTTIVKHENRLFVVNETQLDAIESFDRDSRKRSTIAGICFGLFASVAIERYIFDAIEESHKNTALVWMTIFFIVTIMFGFSAWSSRGERDSIVTKIKAKGKPGTTP